MKQFIEKYGLNSATLKWIAIIFMFLNHICIGLYARVGIDNYFLSTAHWYITRFVFPIFGFLLAEGMHYTRDRLKYILFIFAFAVISQVPYNLVAYGKPICFNNMNVLWTLGISATVIAVIDKYGKKPWISVLVTLLGVSIGYIMNAEFFFIGIPTIVIMYYFRDTKWKQLGFSAIAFIVFTIFDIVLCQVRDGQTLSQIFTNIGTWRFVFLEWHGLLAWLLFLFYNGKKGKNINKWFFYGFYPAHLLLIYLLTVILNSIL